MNLARYKDLCIDATDPQALGAFWSQLLGWEHHVLDDGDSCLRLGDRVMVWLNRVGEPKTVKNRLHIDVNAESLDAALALGATVVDDSQAWTVLRDVEGQELCVFVRPEPVERRPYELVWDVTGGVEDARRTAQWWGELLGAPVGHGDEWSWIEPIDGCPFECFVFGPVPEAKTTKNRVHIDVTTSDLDGVLAAGATLLRRKGDEGIGWHVLADPDGNEFCAFTPE